MFLARISYSEHHTLNQEPNVSLVRLIPPQSVHHQVMPVKTAKTSLSNSQEHTEKTNEIEGLLQTDSIRVTEFNRQY